MKNDDTKYYRCVQNMANAQSRLFDILASKSRGFEFQCGYDFEPGESIDSVIADLKVIISSYENKLKLMEKQGIQLSLGI